MAWGPSPHKAIRPMQPRSVSQETEAGVHQGPGHLYDVVATAVKSILESQDTDIVTLWNAMQWVVENKLPEGEAFIGAVASAMSIIKEASDRAESERRLRQEAEVQLVPDQQMTREERNQRARQGIRSPGMSSRDWKAYRRYWERYVERKRATEQ